MHPKNKATDLMVIFNQKLFIPRGKFFTVDDKKKQVKECAIVCCETAIASHQDEQGMPLGERDIPIIDFWRQVIKEIGKL